MKKAQNGVIHAKLHQDLRPKPNCNFSLSPKWNLKSINLEFPGQHWGAKLYAKIHFFSLKKEEFT